MNKQIYVLLVSLFLGTSTSMQAMFEKPKTLDLAIECHDFGTFYQLSQKDENFDPHEWFNSAVKTFTRHTQHTVLFLLEHPSFNIDDSRVDLAMVAYIHATPEQLPELINLLFLIIFHCKKKQLTDNDLAKLFKKKSNKYGSSLLGFISLPGEKQDKGITACALTVCQEARSFISQVVYKATKADFDEFEFRLQLLSIAKHVADTSAFLEARDKAKRKKAAEQKQLHQEIRDKKKETTNKPLNSKAQPQQKKKSAK